jgi:hypothetical protein
MGCVFGPSRNADGEYREFTMTADGCLAWKQGQASARKYFRAYLPSLPDPSTHERE